MEWFIIDLILLCDDACVINNYYKSYFNLLSFCTGDEMMFVNYYVKNNY